MSFEIQVLEAFQTWRDAALQRHPLEALPTGEELVAAARDHTELEPGGEFPALLVWADALKKVRALALTDNTDVIPVSEDLYEPNLDPFPGPAAAPETTEPEQAEEYLEPEEEYAETVVDDLWASVATPTPTPVQEDYLDEESHPAEATAEEPELAETWDLTQFEEPARDRDTSPEIDPDERHYQPHEFRMLDGFADVEPIPGANLWLEETAAGAIALNWSLPEESYSFGAATRLFRVVSERWNLSWTLSWASEGSHRRHPVGRHRRSDHRLSHVPGLGPRRQLGDGRLARRAPVGGGAVVHPSD